MARVTDEDPSFASDFEQFVHDGVPGELVALLAPLLRGDAYGGTAQMQQAAGRFLAGHAGHGPMVDPGDLSQALAEAQGLLKRYGQAADPGVLARYVPTEQAQQQIMDEQFATPGLTTSPPPRSTGPVRPDEVDPDLPLRRRPEREPLGYSEFGPRPFWEHGGG